jgi:hypothetical protein
MKALAKACAISALSPSHAAAVLSSFSPAYCLSLFSPTWRFSNVIFWTVSFDRAPIGFGFAWLSTRQGVPQPERASAATARPRKKTRERSVSMTRTIPGFVGPRRATTRKALTSPAPFG